MDNIEFIIRDLDWNKSEHVTNNAIQELLKVSEEEAILWQNNQIAYVVSLVGIMLQEY